jgi:hypothetical protein
MTDISAPEDVGALWLATVQRAMGRATHDVKDALNGVSVNLEVIRARAVRPDVPATAIAQFAEAAGNQLERLTALLDAVLSLARPVREPVDVGMNLRRVAALCSASSSPADAQVRVVENDGLDGPCTRLGGTAVRLALLAPLLEASQGTDRSNPATEVVCSIGVDGDATTVSMRAEGRQITMPEAAAETLRAAGVRWNDEGPTLTLIFPHA